MSDTPLAVITGASSGIGAALAHEIARDGISLILIARRVDRLRALAETLPTEAQVFQADLTEHGAMDAVGSILSMLPRAPDILVNNAGIGQGGPFALGSPARDLEIIDLNVRALVDLSHRLLPAMLERGSGGILNIASLAAFQPGPNASVYYASKAFVLSFSDALHEELKGTGVTMSAVCPGPVETEFFDRAGMEGVRLRKAVSSMSAQKVAEVSWRGFKRGHRRIYPGLGAKMRAMTAGLTPTSMVMPVVKALNSEPRNTSD
ncbi:MAG: SDR family oxidoreductase [Pseudomonadota bacterium]